MSSLPNNYVEFISVKSTSQSTGPTAESFHTYHSPKSQIISVGGTAISRRSDTRNKYFLRLR